MNSIEKYKNECIDRIRNYMNTLNDNNASDVGNKIRCIGYLTQLTLAKTKKEIDELAVKAVN